MRSAAQGVKMTVNDLEHGLKQLRSSLTQMGAAVEQMLAEALEATLEGLAENTERTIERDKAVNQMENQIVERAISLIATHQPVAGDLRFLAAALRLATELERVGDLAVNLAQRAQMLEAAWAGERRPESLRQMARQARRMVCLALDAFSASDVAAARRVLELDDLVDELNRQVRREMIELISAQGSKAAWGLELVSTAAHLERLGDHATNLAEEIIYIVSGHSVRHQAFG